MKCFYHPAAEAVGTCKHCSRGVCMDCAAEREGGLACRNRHEAAVDAVSNLVDRNLKLTKSKWPAALMALVLWSIGLASLYIVITARDQAPRLLFGLLALLMIGYAIPQTRYLLIRFRTR